MPKSPRKKQKTTHFQRSTRNRITLQQAKLEETGVEQKGNKLTLFGKSIAIDEQDQGASYYAKLRFWFRHAIPQRSEDSPMPRILDSSITTCSTSSSTARKSQQDSDVPLKDETDIFQKIPPPLATKLSPYSTMRPFNRNYTLAPNFVSIKFQAV
uniref:Uncharacterized protein n=1 Tax=Anopheles maculatus TaxID=74869 RepID=A0A182SJX9_9DIPT